MTARATETAALSKIVRIMMSVALLVGMCASAPMQAQASESVEVTVGDDVPYAGYFTTRMWADGEVAYCAEPAAGTPAPGTYSKSGISDGDLAAAMWFSYGAPGFDESVFPERWYDGTGWSEDKYLVASHVLLSFAYQGSRGEAAYGTNAQFEKWAKDELLGDTWSKVKNRADEVSTGFEAFSVKTGSATQVLMSFTWKTGGLKVAKEDSQAGSAPQGDASLAGARFDIVNASGKSALVDGRSYGDGEVVKTIEAEWDAAAKAYVAATGSGDLPCGVYKVVESQAPEGYLASDWSKTAKIKENGEVVDLTGGPCKDDVARGGVQVTKSDRELGKSEALGGDSHGALGCGSTLSGIEFAITNESAAKVLVGGEWFEPGETVATVTTAWNEEAGAYTAQTAADALPYGTYAIRETKSNDSYLLTDGEPKTFQVRENGAIAKASSGGGELEFFDQVIRNDLEIAKMAEDTNESLQVAFKVTNEATGEAHVVVTDKNGNVSTASSWNKHSANTNGNDRLLGVGAVNASDMDPKAGVWFSLGEDGSVAEVDDGLAALPFGKYTLEELRSDANEGYDLIKKTFVIERDSSAAKAVWMSLDDKEGPKVQTEATDASDGDHVAQVSGEVTLSDTVYYENLKTDGTEYTVTGTLMLKSTGEALVGADGNPVTASKTFRPKQRSGEVELQFAFDGSLLAGEDVVAFESLVSGGVEVAVHADIDDEGQTVHLVGIGTTATDKADGDKLVTGVDITIVDEVAYEGLTPGVEYTLEAALMDAETGDPVTVGGKQVAGTATFAPDEADGVQAVELAFDGTGLGGKGVVVFEKLFAAGAQLAAHEDLSDEGQTVTVVEIGTKLTDAEDGDQVVANGKVKLVDTVEYNGLVPGETYTANGTLIDKSTGETLVDAGGNPVTATAEFAPQAAEGIVEVAFEFDASHLEEGAALVAFERCLDAKGNVVAVHEDVDDEGQTVVVDNPDTPEVPDAPGEKLDKTGVDLMPYMLGAGMALAAALALAAYGLQRRNPDDPEPDDHGHGEEAAEREA